MEFHLSRAVKAADSAGIIELALLLRWISMAARVLIRSTIWHQLAAYNSKMTDFKRALTDELQTRPLFELLPPQRDAIQEVMHTGNRAVVVEMPTSSGKTLLAEFRIIQTKVNVANAWIAYLVPTRALVQPSYGSPSTRPRAFRIQDRTGDPRLRIGCLGRGIIGCTWQFRCTGNHPGEARFVDPQRSR